MTLSKQTGKKIGIFGLGLTGTSVYSSLITVVKELICYDDSEVNIEKFVKEFDSSHILSIVNEKWKTLDKIVISPGIPHSHQIFQIALENKIPVTSDIELFIEENLNSEFIFITGTNGKSTVTALTDHIIRKTGLDYHVGGNIGKAVMSLPYHRKGYVFEVSSFQIELLTKINAKISVITNITPDHLDRYKNVEEYAQVKQKILTPNSLKIIGINSNISQNIYHNLKKAYSSKLIPISNSKQIEGGIFCDNNYLYDDIENDKISIALPSLPHLQGFHNKENIAIAYAICKSLSVPSTFIIKALESFKGLEHRMQYIGSYKNINFYNDSKATNISSALASLSAFDNIIWFAGGKFKEESFDELKPILKNVKKAYFFGESKNLFAEFLALVPTSKPEYEICKNLEESFNKAMGYSIQRSEQLNFLLAPACASYDQFKNFEERGMLFIKLVEDIKNKL
jgi:UDP-N-acetylmuramoylalanine--D-glutamate ligase